VGAEYYLHSPLCSAVQSKTMLPVVHLTAVLKESCAEVFIMLILAMSYQEPSQSYGQGV
jgi:hypothetical protein